MLDRKLFHPALRAMDEDFLATRSAWYSFFYPADERISWAGDIQLYCRDVDYQAILDAVPCVTTTDANGNGRYCGLAGADLDAYRTQVQFWLRQFDDSGRPIYGAEPPPMKPIEPTVPPKVVAGPTKIAKWLRLRR